MPITLTPEGAVSIILAIVGIVGFVVRSNSRNRALLVQAGIDSQVRETNMRNELSRDARESQLKFEKLQESVRAQLLEERNATILEQHKLGDRLLDAQNAMFKLQSELRVAEQKEREAMFRSGNLLKELDENKETLQKIQKQLTQVQNELVEANKQIASLRLENNNLKTEINKIKKGSTQTLVAVTDLPNIT